LTARDGIIARQKLKENAVSLVVTNLRMPGIDGFELLDYIKVNLVTTAPKNQSWPGKKEQQPTSENHAGLRIWSGQ